MKLLYKKRLTYVTIGVYFLLGGIEYAVILPTVWLYLQHDFNAESYMLGLVLSAFSLAALISSPVFGSWSDRTGNTKSVILVCNMFSFCGSIMYSMGISEWFLVGSRLVAGLGAAVGSAIFADIARTTSVAERTGVMSLFMAVRQFGLLAGPGLNLFLRKLDFSIGPLKVNKYTAPGVFMACLWVVHEGLVVFFYWNLPALKKEECECAIKEQLTYPTADSSGSSASINSHPSGTLVFDERGDSQTNETRENSQQPENKQLTPESIHNTQTENPCTFQIGSAPLQLQREDSVISTSSGVIESAEKYMSQSPGYLQYTEVYAKEHLTDTSSQEDLQKTHRKSSDCISNRSESPDQGVGGHVITNTPSVAFENPVANYGAITNGNVNSQRFQSEHKATPSEQKPKLSLKFLYTELLREEVVVILATVFTAFFNQLVLETTCTPFTKKFLGWEELENSILYSIAGVEILVVFVFISWLSKRLHDRYILLIGNMLMVVTLAFLTWFTPTVSPDTPAVTIGGFAAGIAVDLVAIAFLAVIGTSLFSKVTKAENQGFNQGVRRIFSGLGTILGPLWAGGLLDHLYILFGVCLGLSIVVTLMMLLSFKHLKERTVPEDTINIPVDEDQQPLLS